MTCLPNFPAMNLENQKFEGYKTCLKYQRCICPLKLLPDIFKIPKMRTDIYILFHTTIINMIVLFEYAICYQTGRYTHFA